MNPYFILNMQADEVRFNRALAFWLNPFESHGMNDVPGRLFIRRIAQSDAAVSQDINPDSVAVGLVRTEVHLDKKNRIDIQMSTSDLTVWIETKIGSGQRANQIDDYAEAIDKLNRRRGAADGSQRPAVLIFLTPSGADADVRRPILLVPVVQMSFANLACWVNEVIATTTSMEQAVSLAQFREWVTRVASPSAGGDLTDADVDNKLELQRFWVRARDRLAERLGQSDGAQRDWVVGFLGSGNSVRTDLFPHATDYAKLAIAPTDCVLGHAPLVATEGIAGKPLRDTPIIGIMRAYDREGARQKRYTAEEERLTGQLALQGYLSSWHWIGYQRFALHGWPSFHANDRLTQRILANSGVATQLADEIADSLWMLFDEHRVELEALR